MEQDYLEFLHITKNFPGVTALDDVSMSVHRGEIHALVGENGAGKSTLMNILGGNLQPNGGELRLDGHPVKISSPIDAYRKGIGFVHQESNLLENLSVCENVFLGRERVLSLGRTDRKGMCREIRECCQRLGYQLEPERPVAELNLAERQSVEIVRALLGSPRVLILDEPTAALAEDEVARLFRIVRELRQEGVSVLYISHRLDEIMELADRVTVLKDGKLVGTLERGELDKERMVSMMVGRVIEDIYPDRSQVQFGPELLRVEGLTLPGKLEHVSFSVRAGEIVGLGGLEGQGQRTAIRAIFGDQRFSQGSISVENTPLKSGGIAERIRNGVAYVTHDRRGAGAYPVHPEEQRPGRLAAAMHSHGPGKGGRGANPGGRTDGQSPDQGILYGGVGIPPIRRQPTEGDAGPVADDETQSAHHRRAHQRHRHRCPHVHLSDYPPAYRGGDRHFNAYQRYGGADWPV